MTFAEMFNGYNKELSVEKGWGPQFAERVGKDARITHVWDEKEEDAKESAEVCGIENVVTKKEDMIGKVDGIIIADDCTMKHQRKAIPFLKAGIPTFIDKSDPAFKAEMTKDCTEEVQTAFNRLILRIAASALVKRGEGCFPMVGWYSHALVDIHGEEKANEMLDGQLANMLKYRKQGFGLHDA